jgi:predicted PurR-regulated permease PerM
MRPSNSAGPIVWFGILFVTCALLFAAQSVLWLIVPGMIAVAQYYILMPVLKRFVLMGLSFKQAAASVMGILFVLTAVTILFMAPYISDYSGSWQNSIGRYVEGGGLFLDRSLVNLETQFQVFKKMHFHEKVSVGLNNFTSHFAEEHAGSIVLGIAKWIPSLLLVPYLTYFLLVDGSKFKRFLVQAVPNAFFEKTLYLCHRLNEQLRRYFQGMLLLTLLDAVTLAIGLAVIGFDHVILLSVTTAIFAWIPYVGSLLGCFLVVLVAATDFPTQPWMAYGVLMLFILVRMLDEFIYLPITLGKSLRMHPVVSVIMLLVGGAIAGVAGLFLVMPLLGMVMVIGEVLGEILTDHRLLARHQHSKYLRAIAAREGLG